MAIRRVESSREKLLRQPHVAVPQFLPLMVAPVGGIGDHTLCSIYVLEREVATMEVMFAAPVTFTAAQQKVPHACMYRPARHTWYDLHIFPNQQCSGAASTGERRSQRVTLGDYSWLRADLKPNELTALEGYGQANDCTPAPGTVAWRTRVIALICQWVRNAWLVREQENFVNTVGIHERLSFEYHSFLCGIGETASPWNTSAMRGSPNTWMQQHPRVLIMFDNCSSSSSASASAFGGASHVRCRIPLLHDADVRDKIRNRLSLWVDLLCKLRGLGSDASVRMDRQRSDEGAPLRFDATLHLDLALVNSVAYRVDRERVQASFECAAGLPEGQRSAWEQCRDALQLGCSYLLAGDLPYSSGSPATSPRLMHSTSSPSASTSSRQGAPSFSGVHRQQNATIMEYLPSLESNLVEQCIDSPVHYLSLLWALTECFGLPSDFSTGLWSEEGRVARRRALFSTVNSATSLRVCIELQYADGKTVPAVEVRCPSVKMPDSDRPLGAPVRLQGSSVLQFSSTPRSEDTLFNIQAMAQGIFDGVNARCLQMMNIIQITNKEAQDGVLLEETGTRARLFTVEESSRRMIDELEAQGAKLLRPSPPASTHTSPPASTHTSPPASTHTSVHSDPVMDLLTLPPRREDRRTVALVVERDFMHAGEPLVRTRETMRREDTAFHGTPRCANTTSPDRQSPVGVDARLLTQSTAHADSSQGSADITPEANAQGAADITPEANPQGAADTTPEANPQGAVDTTPEANAQGAADITLEANPQGAADITPEANALGAAYVAPEGMIGRETPVHDDVREEMLMEATPCSQREATPEAEVSMSRENSGLSTGDASVKLEMNKKSLAGAPETVEHDCPSQTLSRAATGDDEVAVEQETTEAVDVSDGAVTPRP